MKHISSMKNPKWFRAVLSTSVVLACAFTLILAPRAVGADAQTYAQSYESGDLSLIARDYKSARSQWEQAVKLAATPREAANAQVNLVQALIGLKEYEQADALIRELQGLPKDVLSKTVSLRLESQLLAAQGKIREAAALTKRMFESSPESFPGVKFNPNGTVATLTMTDIPRLLYSHLIGDVDGKTPAEMQAALEVVAKDANAPKENREQARVYVGDLLLQQKKPVEARALYLDAYLGFSTSAGFVGDVRQASLLTKIGDTYALEKNLSEALKAYDRALEVPDIAPSYKRFIQNTHDAIQRELQTMTDTPKDG